MDGTDSLEYLCYILPLNFPSIIPPLEAKPVKQCILKLTKIKSGGRYIIYNAKLVFCYPVLHVRFELQLFLVLAKHMR